MVKKLKKKDQQALRGIIILVVVLIGLGLYLKSSDGGSPFSKASEPPQPTVKVGKVIAVAASDGYVAVNAELLGDPGTTHKVKFIAFFLKGKDFATRSDLSFPLKPPIQDMDVPFSAYGRLVANIGFQSTRTPIPDGKYSLELTIKERGQILFWESIDVKVGVPPR